MIKAPKTVSIVGAGLVGTSCLHHLIAGIYNEGGRRNLFRINLFEQRNLFGPGLAYSATCNSSLANTPVSAMSIMPDRMDDFRNWLVYNRPQLEKGFPHIFPIDNHSYVPRKLFGSYLEEKNREIVQWAKELGVELSLINKAVLECNADNKEEAITTEDGIKYPSDKVVICVGNQPTQSFTHLLGDPGYLSSPYPESAMLKEVKGSKNTLIIGSSLTAIDAILALDASGYKKKIVAASRSGLFPAVRSYCKKDNYEILNKDAVIEQIKRYHKSPIEALKFKVEQALKAIYGQNTPDVLGQKPTESGLLQLKRDLATATAGQAHWQELTTPLTEGAEAAWSMMSASEKKNFLQRYSRPILRYIASFPIQNAKKILSIAEDQRLAVLGELSSVTYDDAAKSFAAAFSDGSVQHFDRVINATGARKSLLGSAWPLARNMQATGLYCFNDFGCFQVNKTSHKVICKKPTQAEVYAPGQGSYGGILYISLIEICIRHAQAAAKDILCTL